MITINLKYLCDRKGANRITEAKFSGTVQHNASYTYDKNGNIMGLTREGQYGESSQYGGIDDLTYAYQGNQLQSVNDISYGAYQADGFKDNGSFLDTEYDYDYNGNMIADSNKSLSIAKYNHLNLPEQLNLNPPQHYYEISYLYSAAGQKLHKATHIDFTPSTTTDYCGSFIYHDDQLQSILTAEGRVVVDGSSYEYQYFLKDHLGNTRITFNESGSIIQEDSYYPYGMNMAGLSHISGEDLPNKFLYNGKELQDDFGLGWYDYGARFYDAVIGRWHVVDPMAEKYNSWSPYDYVANNPILLNDPTGMEWNGSTTQGFNWEGRPDEYEINKTGHVVNQIENKTKDSFHVVDEDGERIEGKSITFEYGTVTGQRNPTNVKVKGEPVKLTTFEIKGDENATKLFEFMSDTKNTGVEWTHAKIGTSTSDKNIVGSTHNKSSTAVGHYLRATGYTLKEVNHNHPSGNNTASPGDRNGAKLYHSKNPSTRLKIYSNKTKSYRGYDENGSTPIPIPMRKITKIF